MKALSKDQLTRRDMCVAELTVQRRKLIDTVIAFNESMAEAYKAIEIEIAAYNETTLKAQALRDEITQQIESYTEEKSDKWLEGDKGTAYATWRDQFLEANLDGVELERFEEIDEPELSAPEDMELWQEEPDLP